MEALDLTTNEVAARSANIRGDGERLLLDLVFIGRGSVQGRALAADGATPVPFASVLLKPSPTFTVSDAQQTERAVRANAAGEFVFVDVPVGAFVLTGFGPDGFTGMATGVIDAAGTRASVNVALTLDPARLGRVAGRVFQGDGATPVPNARVYVGNRQPGTGKFLAVGTAVTDASGSFVVERVPEDEYEVVAVDPATQQKGGVQRLNVPASQTTSTIIVLEATGMVEGVVRNAQGHLVQGAVVAGGFTLGTTDALGFFRIEGVPAGRTRVEAGDPATRRRGATDVTVLQGQTVRAEIVLEARATIVGRVLDANGVPVPRATVRIPQDTGYFFVVADSNGFYRLPDLQLRDYLIQAPGPPWESLVGFMKGIGMDPRRAFTAGDVPTELQSSQPPQTEEEVLAAYSDALQTYIGGTPGLMQALPMAPGGFGWTKVRLFQDNVTVTADIEYLSQGEVSGRTLAADGVPVGALTRLLALTVDGRGSPKFEEVERKNSDPESGAFAYEGIPRFDLTTFQIAGVRGGDFTIEAASPFSPVIASYSSQLNSSNLDEHDIEVRFPDLSETNGTIGGLVVRPDGVTPAGEDIEVVIDFGELTLLTDEHGRFLSTFPIPADADPGGGFIRDRPYRVTAFDHTTGTAGETIAMVPPGGHVDVSIRLVGLGEVVLAAQRVDGTPVVGGRVELCRAVARVLAGEDVGGFASNRATERLEEYRVQFAWLDPEKTAVVRDARGRWAWWTFAGLNANAPLAQALRALGAPVGSADNFRIALDSPIVVDAIHALRDRPLESIQSPVNDKAIDGLKFSACLPESLARKELAERLTDPEAIAWCKAAPVSVVST